QYPSQDPMHRSSPHSRTRRRSMHRILGWILAGGLVLAQAPAAKAQMTFSFGNRPGVTVGQPYYGGYPGSPYAPTYSGYGSGYAAPAYGYGTTTYSTQPSYTYT